jgi:hypothetical protein
MVLSRRMLYLSAVALVSLVLLGGATAAFGETLSPWWHLRTTTRPTSIQPGTATDEVQQVTLLKGVETYELMASGGGLLGRCLDGEQACRETVELTRAESASEIEAALENVYGSGDVEVTTPQQGAEEALSYDVTFVGSLTDLPVGLILNAGTNEAATVRIKQLTLGRPDGEIVLSLANVGDADANPEVQPVSISDDLPRGLHVVAIEGSVDESGSPNRFATKNNPIECSLVAVSCEFNGQPPPAVERSIPRQLYPKFVAPFETIQVVVAVNVEPGGVSGENTALVRGGGAPAASLKRSLAVSDAPIPFGLSDYEMSLEEQGGASDTQAGSHPFQLTATEEVNQTVQPRSVGLAKDLHFKLPPGLLGDPSAIPRCTLIQFDTPTEQESFADNKCPPQTVVGVNVVLVVAFDAGEEPFLVRAEAPVYNLEPGPGEPARFGFVAEGTRVLLSTAVRTGGDYGVTVSASNVSQSIEFLSNEITFWGVPGAQAHDTARGVPCLKARAFETEGQPDFGEGCELLREQHPSAFLSLPTSCTGRPLESSVEGDSWEEPDHVFAPFFTTTPMVTLDGCNRLPFEPSIKATPGSERASEPMGLNIDVHVNQDSILDPDGLAESAVRDITVALPEEVAVNAAAGDGLEACSEGLVGFKGFEEPRLEPGVSVPVLTPRLPGSTAALAAGETAPLQPGLNFCANASKIGEVTIHTPVLPNPLKGFVYLAAQEENPFGSLVAMYIVAEDPVSGTLVKLPGVVHLTSSGQIISTFENNPQDPFEDVELHLFDGERASLASPARCGAHTTDASFTPWSGGATVNASSTFNITSGPNGSSCPGASLPFSPSLTAGTTNISAGAFTPFTMTMSRESGQQSLQAVELKLPEGLSGVLSGVELCPEPQADQGLCGPNSQIGETTASVGVGREPFTVTGGKVYITGPFNGTGACTVGEAGCAPFGLSIVSPAKAGPYDLANTKANHPPCDCVLVRGKIEFNPLTTALTVTTDNSGPYKIPTILEGIPLQIQHVNATITRPGFQFNPTSCNKMEIAGNVFAAEGASAAISVPFQATNCQTLKFEPRFTVSTSGKTSKANGASLTTKVEEPAGSLGTQANIAMVKVELPEQLPSRLTTLQKACTDAQFELNPAGCPPESKIGYAVVHTPALPVPLQGPAIFVSHGGEAFPSLTMVLQGYGITVDLVGATLIRKGITSTTFKAVPDQPFSTFELTLPEGKFSALAANGNLCTTSSLYLPYEAIGQNGAVVRLKPKIAVTGCAKKKPPLTRAQKLTAALKACKKKSKNKRATCEHTARKQYGTTTKKKK